MKQKKKKWDRYTFLGIYVLLSVILNVTANAFTFDDYLEVLWFCDVIAIVLGVALLTKNKTAITTTFITCVPTQFFWIVDFFLELAGVGMGRTAFLFEYGMVDFILSLNLHMILIPISGYATYKLGFSKKSLYAAIAIAILLLPTTFLLTDVDDNRNCVFYPCDAEFPGVFEKSHYVKFLLINSVLFWCIMFCLSYLCFNKIFSLKVQRQQAAR